MVSLIIPCYNAEKYLKRCLDSVLRQTDHDIELILVNDGSTDGTEQMIEHMRPELESELTRFVYIVQENQGVGAACNVGFKHATGKYLALLDSDDMMLPDSIKLRVQWLDENEEYGVVRTNGYYVSEDNPNDNSRLLEINVDMKVKENIFEDIFKGTTYLWPGTYMIRMDILEKLYPSHEIYPSRGGQNLQFLMMACYISRAGFIDLPLMRYVIRKESLSHFSTGNVMKNEMEAMLRYKDIRAHLIEQFMSGDEKVYWEKQLELLYGEIFVALSCKHRNRHSARQYYNNLKAISEGKVSLKTSITYYKMMNPAVYLVLRVCRKLRVLK